MIPEVTKLSESVGVRQVAGRCHVNDKQGPVVVLGGHGQVGLLLTTILIERGRDVRSVIRKGRQVAAVEALGAEAVIFNLEAMNASDLAKVLRGASAVVFTAGAGPGSETRRKRTVDYGASVLAQRAALEAGVSRFIQVSAFGLQYPVPEDASPNWREYVRAKRDADIELTETMLDWTIVRPAALTDEPGTGAVTAAFNLPAEPRPAPVSRADVAAVIAALLDYDVLVRQAFDLAGGSTPILRALNELAVEAS